MCKNLQGNNFVCPFCESKLVRVVGVQVKKETTFVLLAMRCIDCGERFLIEILSTGLTTQLNRFDLSSLDRIPEPGIKGDRWLKNRFAKFDRGQSVKPMRRA
jgi:hypothetical protein